MSLQTLLVDDDRGFAQVAAAALAREGFPVTTVHALHAAREAIARSSFELVVLDRRLPDGDGLTFLPELKGLLPHAAVVMVTAHGDIASAVDAVRAGAADYLVKPIELPELVLKAKGARERVALRERLQRAEDEISGRHRLLPPTSKAMREVVALLERVAQSPKSPVLLLGETGVGKEVLAWHVHRSGVGERAPFIHVNCAALPEATAESELFGHEKGAFTDAKGVKRGLVELAHGGTLFLDEVGELSAAVQAKLLTFLDRGAFRRLGGQEELQSQARIIGATNRELEADVKGGRFREDLWFRLSVFRVEVPPLRSRPEDLAPLAAGLLERLSTELGRRGAGLSLSPAALGRLRAYPFPGNVRELKNLLERGAVLEPGPVLELDGVLAPPAAERAAAGFNAPAVVPIDVLETRYVRWALEQLGGRRMEAAKALGLSYPTFLKRLEEEG